MSDRVWTQAQSNAINARGETLLLSAAAGSGKTAVLVERIIKLLTDEKTPTEPSQLLVVTFTNAAAAEMRSRINNGIDSLIEGDPDNSFYRNIKMKMPEAQICTIDSFCIKLVRENFHAVGIVPEFRLLDESRGRILRADAMTKTLEDLSANDPQMYDMLNSMTAYGRDDGSLSEKILRLYNFSLAHPFPDKWLRDTENMYNEPKDVKTSVWGKTIIDNFLLTADYCKELLQGGLLLLPKCPEIEDCYEQTLIQAAEDMEKLEDIVKNHDWDSICRTVNSYSLPSLPRAPRGFGSDPVKMAVKAKYDKVKSLVTGVQKTFCADTEENAEDLRRLRPVIHGLIETVRAFGKNYDELKDEQESYGFTDIMHKALDILGEEKDGEIVRTPLAQSLSDTYREILIDEYQDTNEAQDMLFNLISKNSENIFMVGDVKQSIYKFRLAMPEIFMKKSREYTDFDGANYPSKIILGVNFRSRKGVLDGINFLFENLMSENAGDMEYTEKEALHYGNGYDGDADPCVELHFAESEKDNASPEYIGGLIKKMIGEGVTVYDKGQKRPAKYSDFCILLRSVKAKSDIYERTLTAMGIPVSCERQAGLFETTEIMVFMSLLKAVDNPTDDVSLLSIMLSPLYGFTPDEVADLKIPDKKLNLYSCLVNSDTEKAKKLLEDLAYYRQISAVMPFESFIRNLLYLTGYDAVVGAMKNGEDRKNNLLILCELAGEYMEFGGSGLGGFIRYINKTVESGCTVPSAASVSENANMVRIYSIHKSKGLEFPFVILGDCERMFNSSDSREDMIISPALGVGMVVIDNSSLKKYSTLCHAAAKINIKKSAMSEELRILYVAMTRARERLICVSNVSDTPKTLQKYSADLTCFKKPHPLAVINSSSIMQWLIIGYITHPAMDGLVKDTDLGGLVLHDYTRDYSPIKVVSENLPQETDEEQQAAEILPPDKNLTAELKGRIEYEYLYKMPEDARPKRIASDFENHEFREEYFASEKPAFLLGGKLTPAQIGTANHLFLQCCDFDNDNIEDECRRLAEKGVLDEAQAREIRINKMKKFRSSDIFKRIRSADRVYREKEFTVELALGDIEPTANENVKDEKVLILGKADIVFVEDGRAVVVDYKTDRKKTDEEFISAYAGQLKMYRLAMEQILGIPVKETLIYSLQLEKTIEID
ncbi:MAG: helicase-exonuclease AddAB subunit AddA [Clostridiales bacterium]|nr:helicase-exonuclease AddAB subunit AddA [Clostridiales bacterium]